MIPFTFTVLLILVVYGVLIVALWRRVLRIEQENFLEDVQDRHKGSPR